MTSRCGRVLGHGIGLENIQRFSWHADSHIPERSFRTWAPAVGQPPKKRLGSLNHGAAPFSPRPRSPIRAQRPLVQVRRIDLEPLGVQPGPERIRPEWWMDRRRAWRSVLLRLLAEMTHAKGRRLWLFSITPAEPRLVLLQENS